MSIIPFRTSSARLGRRGDCRSQQLRLARISGMDVVRLSGTHTNCDPSLMRVWMQWIGEYTGRDVRLTVTVHSASQVETAKRYWRRQLKYRGDIFSTVAVSSASKRRRIHFLPNGTLRIDVRTGNREWFIKMTEWLRLASKDPFSAHGAAEARVLGVHEVGGSTPPGQIKQFIGV